MLHERFRHAEPSQGIGRRIELRDHRELKGYITSVGDDQVVISDLKSGKSTTLLYSGVLKAKELRVMRALLKP
jgi:hypothetical protein